MAKVEKLVNGKWRDVDNLADVREGDVLRQAKHKPNEVFGVVAKAREGGNIKIYTIAAQLFVQEKIKL